MELLKHVSVVTALAIAISASSATAEDVLYSKRHLAKRQLNAEGNYNMC